jgi:signal transduction histidine kinase
MVNSAFEDCQIMAVQKSIRYQLELIPAVVQIQGDRYLLPETVINLITNAIKYTGEGGHVSVKLHTENDRAVFEVEDTGFGIPEDQQANLFQPFFRAKTKETRSINGTGLGLHLVKSIIEHHRGQMRFHSIYGQGSTFGFDLPLAAQPKPVKKRRATAKQSSP